MAKISFRLDEKFLKSCVIFGKAEIKTGEKFVTVKNTKTKVKDTFEDEIEM